MYCYLQRLAIFCTHALVSDEKLKFRKPKEKLWGSQYASIRFPGFYLFRFNYQEILKKKTFKNLSDTNNTLTQRNIASLNPLRISFYPPRGFCKDTINWPEHYIRNLYNSMHIGSTLYAVQSTDDLAPPQGPRLEQTGLSGGPRGCGPVAPYNPTAL